MSRHGKYPIELRTRAVRMVLEHQHEYGSQWEAICSVAEKLGPTPETVRLWARQAERDEGRRPGPTGEEQAELKRLRRDTLSCAARMTFRRRRRHSSRRSSTASPRSDPVHRRTQGSSQR